MSMPDLIMSLRDAPGLSRSSLLVVLGGASSERHERPRNNVIHFEKVYA